MEAARAAATTSVHPGVSADGGDRLPAPQHPSILFNLMMGKPVDLVEITVPELSFSFLYRQEFPIIGPLVGTFAGGFGANARPASRLRHVRAAESSASHNAAALFEGFFFERRTSTGNPLPVATLHGDDRRRRGNRPRPDQGRRRRRHQRAINFSWDDLDRDGKVRFDEMIANILANGGDPLAVFDIDGELRSLPARLRHDRPVHHVVHAEVRVRAAEAASRSTSRSTGRRCSARSRTAER